MKISTISAFITRYAIAIGLSAAFLLACLPMVAFAQDAGYFRSLVTQSGTLVDLLIALVVAIALVLFIWGLAVFIFRADDETERAKGRQLMIWGIISLFVIVSIWGIVVILRNLFGTTAQTFNAPGVSDVGTRAGNGD